MTENTAADDGDRGTAMTQPPESFPAGRVAVGKYFRLAACGVAWAVLNMALVDSAFELTHRPPPYHVAQIFAPFR